MMTIIPMIIITAIVTISIFILMGSAIHGANSWGICQSTGIKWNTTARERIEKWQRKDGPGVDCAIAIGETSINRRAIEEYMLMPICVR